MAAAREYGKPDFFTTFTCNRRWRELEATLLGSQSPADRPDITARVFQLKRAALPLDFFRNHGRGRPAVRLYAAEFHKRGVPRAHISVILHAADERRSTDDYDRFVFVELPAGGDGPGLWYTVTTCMARGPCGTSSPEAPCVEAGECAADGAMAEKRGALFANRRAAPYKKWLARRYNAHISVEIRSTVQAAKYIYKYVYKGPGRAVVRIGPE